MSIAKKDIELILDSFYGVEKEDGVYYVSIDADYQDKLPIKKANEILCELDPMNALNDWICNSYESAVDYMANDIREAIQEKLLEAGKIITEKDVECLEEFCDENLYFSLPTGHFLKQKFPVNIFVDTGDGNYDFVLNNTYPAYDGNSDEPIDEKASLVWLVRQQGYSRKQLQEALWDKKSENVFLNSIRTEVVNVSTHMNALVFMVQMDLETLIGINEALQNHTQGFLKIPKNACTGLYDPWNGGGSILGIELEQDVLIHFDFVRSALPDGGDGYSISSVYGMCLSAWDCDNVSILNSKQN